jgi:hypothetical protein
VAGVERVRYLLITRVDPAIWEALTDDERDEVVRGHADFVRTVTESGELVGVEALAEPADGTTVRILDRVPSVTNGPYRASGEHLAGFYVVDCDSRHRAVELAFRIPDVRHTGVEIRRLLTLDGTEA